MTNMHNLSTWRSCFVSWNSAEHKGKDRFAIWGDEYALSNVKTVCKRRYLIKGQVGLPYLHHQAIMWNNHSGIDCTTEFKRVQSDSTNREVIQKLITRSNQNMAESFLRTEVISQYLHQPLTNQITALYQGKVGQKSVKHFLYAL